MTHFCSVLFFCIIFSALPSQRVCAQEPATENIDQASIYLNERTASLQQYLGKSEKIQQRLLKKLQRKETRMLRQLAAKDSALYCDYVAHGVSYDSIMVLSKDTAYLGQYAGKGNATIDSLKGVQHFIENQQSKLATLSSAGSKSGIEMPKELGQLQQQLNTQQQLDNLIQQRTAGLESLAKTQNIKGLESIQKDVYYAKEKIKNWKALADEPDDAEAVALEYLQGTEGFDKYLQPQNNAFGGLGANATAEDLQRLGFQTKGAVNNMLQQKLGNSMSAVQQQMGAQVKEYTDKLGDLTKKVDDVKQNLSEAKDAIATAKETKDNIKNIEKPSFKKNPEKGKPFLQRLETQYNFQTSRSSTDGLKPAMMDIGATVGFKHTPRLSYGIGLGLSAGLGQNWQHLKLTYEGITLRAYADWKWIYGFSFQAGYERSFRPTNRAYLASNTEPTNPTNPTIEPSDNSLKEAFGGQQQTGYVGIMKRYKINKKWNGTFLVGYNFLWQQEDMRSPFLLRFGWGK